MAVVEFDQIAGVYDETRRALDEETSNGIAEMLSKHGCRSILEIGVGTGRVAIPLLTGGYEIMGVDISRRMMEKARAKGMRNLFLAEGSKAPFRDNSVDATLMAHVFHLLEKPMSVMREAARISRVGVFALVRKRRGLRGPWSWLYGRDNSSQSDNSIDETTKRLFDESRERLSKIARKYGWSWESSQRFRNWRREQEILQVYPPDDLKVVSDVVVSYNIDERIARLEKGGYSFMSRMPVAMRKEIVEEMRSRASSLPQWTSQPRHEVYQLALWNSKTLLH